MATRLTLRYLLAYLHGVGLSPEEAQDLGRRIEESERATGLVHRIREVTRRLRLGAPGVSERGQWLDPNTVAEYLDNRLPDSQVPDFEKVCFESDVQLAEVASCHEILATVLHEPAEVDPVSRQRMYRLAEAVRREEQGPGGSAEPAGAASQGGEKPAVQPPAQPARPTVPDYLRRTAVQRTWWRTAVALALALGIVFVVLVVAGQIEPRTLWGRFVGTSGEGSRQVAVRPERGGPVSEPGPSADHPGAGDSAPRPEPRAVADDRPASGLPPAPSAPGPAGEPASSPKRTERPPVEPQPDKAAPSGTKAPPGPGKLDAQPPGPRAAPPSEDGMPSGPGLKQPPGALEPSPRLPPGEPMTRPPASAGAKTVLPAERIGVLVSPGELLLRLNARTGSWLRVADQAQVTSQDRVVSLPLFKPVVAMSSARAQLHLINDTGVRFLASHTHGVPGLVVEFGRVIVRPDGTGPTRLRLQIGERVGMVTFADADATLAVDVGRAAATGNDPETQPGALLADLYVTTGKVLWQEGLEGKAVTLASPIRATLSEQALDTTALQQFPRWVLVDAPLEPLEQQTATTFERAVTTDRPASLSLRELAEHRRKEVRVLAMRSLCLIEDFDPVLDALNNPDERNQWDEYIEHLREAVSRSPRAAALVRSAMERVHGDEGASLYEMLWKYRTETITPAEARLLVRHLDHETLIFRVLAIGNLRNLTGVELKYRPDDPASKRQPAIQRWKERLNTHPTLRGRPTDEGKARAGEPRGTGPRAKAPSAEPTEDKKPAPWFRSPML